MAATSRPNRLALDARLFGQRGESHHANGRSHKICAMTQEQRTCRFCGQPGSSEDHIIPKWIGRLLSEGAPPGTHYVFHHRSANPEAGVPEHGKTAKLPAYVTRAFCEPCNNGWMSDLETRVRPALEPLVLGESRTLSRDEQGLLAFWATKTLLGFQALEDESTEWARPDEYSELYKYKAALPNSQVWLGAGEHEGDVAWHRAHTYAIGSEQIDGFGATLAVGHAVFYLAIGYAARPGVRLRYDAAFALKEIWPSARDELRWPPAVTLPKATPEGVAPLVQRHNVILPAKPPHRPKTTA